MMSILTEYYQGELYNNLPNGKGTKTYADGSKYSGDWKCGLKHGVGCFTTPNGRTVYRCYLDDVEVGQYLGMDDDTFIEIDPPSYEGKILNVSENGDLYEGQWRDGKRNGYGKLSLRNGSIKEGFFVDNLLIGNVHFVNNNKIQRATTIDDIVGNEVRINYTNRSTYTGYVDEKCKRNGYGRFIEKKKEYRGLFVENQFIAYSVRKADGSKAELNYLGEVSAEMADGSQYVGEWNRGRSGKGRASSEKYHYEGEWANNSRNGFGKCIYLNKSTFEGYFVNDLMEGTGLFSYSDGSSYSGSFSNGKRNGIGRYSFKDGVYAEGNWKNDQKNGSFHFYVSDSFTIDANYINDTIKSDCVIDSEGHTVNIDFSEQPHLINESSIPSKVAQSIVQIIKSGLIGSFNNNVVKTIEQLFGINENNEKKQAIVDTNKKIDNHIENKNYPKTIETKNNDNTNRDSRNKKHYTYNSSNFSDHLDFFEGYDYWNDVLS